MTLRKFPRLAVLPGVVCSDPKGDYVLASGMQTLVAQLEDARDQIKRDRRAFRLLRRVS